MSWPIEGYIAECELRLARSTWKRYREVLVDAQRRVHGKALEDLTQRDLLDLAVVWRHRAQNLSALRQFLAWAGSPLALKVPHGIPPE